MERKRKITLQGRFIISGMALVIGILAVTAILITVLVDRKFNNYLVSAYTNDIDMYHQQMSSALETGNGDDVVNIGTTAATEGYYIEILSEEGNIMYASPNITSMSMMGRAVSLLQMKKMPMYSNVEVKSWVIESGQTRYLLNIGYDMDIGLSEDAQVFKNSVYMGIFFALVIGIIISYIGSKWLSKPMVDEIVDLKDGAKNIRSGQLSHRFDIHSTVTEISELKQAMNDMATNL